MVPHYKDAIRSAGEKNVRLIKYGAHVIDYGELRELVRDAKE